MQTQVAMSASDEDFSNINIYTAPSNKILAKDLADRIENNFRGGDLIFQPVHLITPNKAQHNWLKEQLANKLGFIGNLEQHSLQTFFKELGTKLFPKKKDLPGRGRLVWNLFSELGKEEFQSQFPKIGEYCGEDEVKRLALAQKLAGLFQDYEQYRPNLIRSWKEGVLEDSENENEGWQAHLYVASGFDQNFVHPNEFAKQLKEKSKVLESYRQLYMFGDISMTPLQLEYLKVLRNIEGFNIFIYRSNLNFKKENNPLAQNLGELAIIAEDQLKELGKFSGKAEVSKSQRTGLETIQQSILQDKDPDNLEQDESLLIYNCFTKVREVEALYNYLVKTVDEAKGKLGARDIAVYVPNLDPYIPAIKTVFDSGTYKFPYTLVSKGFSREESFWTSLEQVLSFEEQYFTAPKVFNLLEMQPIQQSFGFKDLELLRKAFIDANISREYEGSEELETHYGSFKNGLERLIYGFCLGDESPVEINGKMISPVDIVEGADAQDLFRLHHLVELLNGLLKKKNSKRTAADWHKELMQIAEDFLNPEDWQEKKFSNLMENLVTLETSEEKIEFNTFFHRLKDHLQNQDMQQITGSGGIVFSGLYSGVSMPKKVVAFLGLNFQEFPRKSQNLSFDLLKDGDRTASRVEDRGAFLQAFLNAEEKVLLSYLGQNVKDNSEIPASSLISELQDLSTVNIKEVKHPLHTFNSAYFDPENRDLFTYSSTRDAIPQNKGKKEISVPEEIPLYVLEAFLKDPFKHHYNQVLKIYYEDPEMLPDWECFELDNLQNWSVKDKIKEERMKGEDLELEELRKKMLLKSEIPLKNIGRSKLRETEERVTALWEKVEEIKDGSSVGVIKDDFTINLSEGQKIKLKIELDSIGKDVLFLIVSKKDKLKYELSAYIRALALKAIGGSGILHYFCLDGNDPHYQEIHLDLCAEEAREELKELAKLYIENFDRIIPFYPELDLKVDKLKDCEDKPGVEKTELIRGLIDGRFDTWNSFFPSDYFLREFQQGYFTGNKGEANLLELQKLTIEITEKVNKAFNKE